MDQIIEAQQLRLPEVFYVLYLRTDIAKPEYLETRIKHAIATAIVWELVESGVLLTQGREIVKTQQIVFKEHYMQKAAMIADASVPVSGNHLIWEIMYELYPILTSISDTMVAKRLLVEEVQTHFIILKSKVYRELPATSVYCQDLLENIHRITRNLQDPNYDSQLLLTDPSMLACLLILETHKLLTPIVGNCGRKIVKAHLENIRKHLLDKDKDLGAINPKYDWNPNSNVGCVYDSGSAIWLEYPDYSLSGGCGRDDGYFDEFELEEWIRIHGGVGEETRNIGLRY
jgi:hypothetical protein